MFQKRVRKLKPFCQCERKNQKNKAPTAPIEIHFGANLYSFITNSRSTSDGTKNLKSQAFPRMSSEAEETLQKLFKLLYSPQNCDIKEPRLDHILPVNCISEQFCGGRYLTHTKSNQACQIEAAGSPASPESLCVSASPPLPIPPRSQPLICSKRCHYNTVNKLKTLYSAVLSNLGHTDQYREWKEWL